MKYSCIIRAEGDKGLYEALNPDKSQTKRAFWNITKNKNFIEVKIEAADIISLKAFTSSITKLIEIYDKVGNKNEQEHRK